MPGNIDNNISCIGGDELCQDLLNGTVRQQNFFESDLPITLPGNPLSWGGKGFWFALLGSRRDTKTFP
jgi:hypothetical protein